jgi:hypothetical protein
MHDIRMETETRMINKIENKNITEQCSAESIVNFMQYNENYSYLILISGLDSNDVKNSVISSFVPVQVPAETLPVSVSRIVIAATLKTPVSPSIDPIFTVKTYFTIYLSNMLDYLNIVVNKTAEQSSDDNIINFINDEKELVMSEGHKIYARENYLTNNIFLSPIKVNPSNLPDSDCLAIIPEPKSKLSAFSGFPNEMYNTSASSSYSNDILSDFSINSSILSSYPSTCLSKKQSKQNHLLSLTLCKQLSDIYLLKQGFYQTFLLQEESLHLPVEQDSVCLKPLLFHSLCLAFQDELCKYVLSVPLLILLEYYLLKMQHASFEDYNSNDYISFSVNPKLLCIIT